MRVVCSIIFFVLVANTASTQDLSIDQSNASGEFVQDMYWMHGNSARRFMKAIQPYFVNSFGPRYYHSSKKMTIQGVEGAVKLRVKEGIYGKRSKGDCCETYFAAFSSDRYRKERTSQMSPSEEYGISISVKRKKHKGFSSYEEQKALVRYIESLI